MIKALFPGTKRKLFALFFLNAERQYFFAEVVRLTGTRQGAVQRELKTLAEAGILNTEKHGRQTFYSVNKANPIYSDLRNIVFKTFGVVGQVRDALEPLKRKIKIAFIYGSFARGEETAGSDIDLFIIGRISLDEVVSTLAKVENALGREINAKLLSEKEFKEKYSKKNHFVRSVLDSKQEFIIGTQDELRRLAE